MHVAEMFGYVPYQSAALGNDRPGPEPRIRKCTIATEAFYTVGTRSGEGKIIDYYSINHQDKYERRG